MPERSADRLRGMLDAFAAGGIDAVLADVDPEVAWHAPPEWLEERVYRGHEGIRELASYWVDNFDEYRLDLDRAFDLDSDRAAALVHQRGRIKGGGAQIEQQVGYVAEFRNRKLIRMEVYFSWEATLDAAGVDPNPAAD
jgi:ketosteroid isomerase-like protein